MSTLENSQVWSTISKENLDSKYEKCRNITEEIYKRINITFEIKKLETATQSDPSDLSDQIDSNELSNETDLFACDKSDSLSSSTEAEKPTATCVKYININNNEETKLKKAVTVCKRPKKRFRKRVKKRQSKANRSDSDGSSDEGMPLSRIVELDTKCKSEESAKSGSPDNVMGVPKIVILTKDLKPKIKTQENTHKELATVKDKNAIDNAEKPAILESKNKSICVEWKCCLCGLSFRGERGLRRHMTMSHIEADKNEKTNQKVEPA